MIACIVLAIAGWSVAPPAVAPPAVASRGDKLVCKIQGFYPFPKSAKQGVLAWLFRDTHQAILVSSADGRIFADFMTAGGQAHSVWWDDATKWHVLCGGCIDGEVRVRSSSKGGMALDLSPDSKLARLESTLRDYDCSMNLYTNNCRIFACRMEREVQRLNAEDAVDAGDARAGELLADVRLAFGLLKAAALPALYPLGTLLLCWEGIKDL